MALAGAASGCCSGCSDTVEQARPPQDGVGGVREAVVRTLQVARQEHRLVRDPSERKVHLHLRHLLHLGGKVCVAGPDLLRQRLVLRGHALDRVADARVHQPQRILGADRDRSARQPGIEEGLVEEDPGVIPREGARGAVRPVHTRGKTDDEDARVRVTERGHRVRPVVRVTTARFLEECREPRTAPALRIVGRRGHRYAWFSHPCAGSQRRRSLRWS